MILIEFDRHFLQSRHLNIVSAILLRYPVESLLFTGTPNSLTLASSRESSRAHLVAATFIEKDLPRRVRAPDLLGLLSRIVATLSILSPGVYTLSMGGSNSGSVLDAHM